MAREKISGVYEIKNTLNNHRYVGHSADIYYRWQRHKMFLNNGSHANRHLLNAWNKYGQGKFEWNILERCEPIRDTLLMIEQKYLDLKPEYNICMIAGAGPVMRGKENYMWGKTHSKETRHKMFLKSPKGKNHFMYGKKLSEEHKAILSKANKNKIVSEETRNKFRKPMLMKDMISNEIIMEFKSIGDAGIFVGSYNRRVEIKRCAQGKRKNAYGYNWEYKNIEDANK